MPSKKEYFARFGIGSKGSVYVLMGVLTAFQAFNMGGENASTKDALQYIVELPLGQLLLAVMALGLFSYAFWRLYQVFKDSRHHGNGYKGIFIRIGYFSGAVFYGFLGVTAIQLIIRRGYESHQKWLTSLLYSDYGKLLTVLLGLILAGKAVYEFYFAYSNIFKKYVHASELEPHIESFLLRCGKFGYTSRGIVFGIMSFLTIKAGLSVGGKKMNTITDAFQLLKVEFGAVILAIVAIGLIGFGVFLFLKARYVSLNMN